MLSYRLKHVGLNKSTQVPTHRLRENMGEHWSKCNAVYGLFSTESNLILNGGLRKQKSLKKRSNTHKFIVGPNGSIYMCKHYKITYQMCVCVAALISVMHVFNETLKLLFCICYIHAKSEIIPQIRTLLWKWYKHESIDLFSWWCSFEMNLILDF